MAWSPSTPPATTAGSTSNGVQATRGRERPGGDAEQLRRDQRDDAVGEHRERQHHVRPGTERQHGIGVVEGLQHTIDRTDGRVEEPWGAVGVNR